MNLQGAVNRAIEARREDLQKQLTNLTAFSALAEKLPVGYPVKFSASIYESWILFNSREAGAARELAATLSTELDVEFTKHYYEKYGDWTFTTGMPNGLRIQVSSKPPQNCNIREVVKEATVYEIDCEEGVA